jgi:hypothetical protein
MPKHDTQTPPVVGARFAVHGNVVNVTQAHAAFPQTIFNGFGRQSGPVFDPAEPLFLGCGNEAAVAQQAGRRITVISVEAEDEHGGRRQEAGADGWINGLMDQWMMDRSRVLVVVTERQ